MLVIGGISTFEVKYSSRLMRPGIVQGRVSCSPTMTWSIIQTAPVYFFGAFAAAFSFSTSLSLVSSVNPQICQSFTLPLLMVLCKTMYS